MAGEGLGQPQPEQAASNGGEGAKIYKLPSRPGATQPEGTPLEDQVKERMAGAVESGDLHGLDWISDHSRKPHSEVDSELEERLARERKYQENVGSAEQAEQARFDRFASDRPVEDGK